MPQKKMHVQLLAYTPQCESVVAMGARICYSGAQVDDLFERVQEVNQEKFLNKLVQMGHLSPVEHVSFTFGVEGVSRVLLAQLTRHRLASFSVQSQRYVAQTAEGIGYVVPPSIANLGQEAADEYAAQMVQMQAWYEGWCSKLGEAYKEDARFVLPNACETRLVMTMNARELQHFFQVRCCRRAQWEIRTMAWNMLGHVLKVAPVLYGTSGPSCAHGACGEGSMSCKGQEDVRRRFKELMDFVKTHGGDTDFPAQLETWVGQ